MRSVLLSFLLALGLVGCGDDVVASPQQPGPNTNTGNGGNLGAGPDGGADANTPAAQLNLRDESFVESPQNRDPFRSYARLFKMRPPETVQRRVIMPTIGIDEMTLIAIVTGTADARAMFTDPAAIGYIVERGDYIGRAEVVQSSGDQGMAVTLNWRVDRIRPDSVVLVRVDPTTPNETPPMRVIPLHDANETPSIAASGQGVTVVGSDSPPGTSPGDDARGTLNVIPRPQ